jgi:hypothetical protein
MVQSPQARRGQRGGWRDGLNKASVGTPVDLVITDEHAEHGRPEAGEGAAGCRNTRACLLVPPPSRAAKKQAAGATGWIVKPFDPDRLLATVAKVLS